MSQIVPPERVCDFADLFATTYGITIYNLRTKNRGVMRAKNLARARSAQAFSRARAHLIFKLRARAKGAKFLARTRAKQTFFLGNQGC